MQSFQVALLQMAPCGRGSASSLEKGEHYCRLAKGRGADLALFPEMWNTGYQSFNPVETGALERWLADSISANGIYVSHFQRLAKALNMAIAITYLENWAGQPRNTVSIFDRRGQLCLTYSKVHTCAFDWEAALIPGSDFYVSPLETEAGTVSLGAMICFDREFPESARILMLKGAEIILVPNACEMEENRTGQLRARAFENMVGVALANYAGPEHRGRSVAFDAVAFRPDGLDYDPLIVRAGDQEGVYMAEFDLDRIREYRRREVWGNAYRRPECYRLLSERGKIK